MNVYLLWQSDDHEASRLCAVYEDEFEAEKDCAALNAQLPMQKLLNKQWDDILDEAMERQYNGDDVDWKELNDWYDEECEKLGVSAGQSSNTGEYYIEERELK